MEIIEGNKLIAEFMGLSYNISWGGSYITSEGSKSLGELKYHSSWDWLMPVVEKIGQLHSNHKISRANLTKEADKIFNIYLITKINPVWLAVVEFIKWYNKNK